MNKSDNTNQKAVWMIGLAIIIFLILLLGSVIGLRIVRNRANDVADAAKQGNNRGSNMVEEHVNYSVTASGIKENNSEGVIGKEIDIDMVRFSGFRIREESMSIDENETIVMDEFEMFAENMTEEVMKDKAYIVKFIGDDGETIASFSVKFDELPSREPVPFNRNMDESCVNAAQVVIESFEM